MALGRKSRTIAVALSGISATLVDMTDERFEIADKVRGVATEKRYSQQSVATLLGLSRGSVSERFTGKVPFGAHEIFRLSEEFGVPVTRFFPEPNALAARAPHRSRNV